ncbi:MAG: DUF4198 domain-containing protein [Desulfofundulus sp.]
MESSLELVRDREIWVLPESSHAHEGHETRCRVFYGHAMHPDGLAEMAHLSAWAVAPGGEKISLKVEPGDDKFHVVVFTPTHEGFWPVTVENRVGAIAITRDGFYCHGTRREYPDAREVVYYHQYAGTWVQVGHFCATCSGGVHPPEVIRPGHVLELVTAPGTYRVGDEVILEVLYQGKPLPGTEVKATWSLREEQGWGLSARTDEAGRVRFSLGNPGHWLFGTRYAGETPVGEEYDKRVYTATLSIFGVR